MQKQKGKITKGYLSVFSRNIVRIQTLNRERPLFAKLKKLIGAGGMGLVFEAVGSDAKRLALKFASAHNPRNTEFLKREIKVLSSASHENIVRLVGSGIAGIPKRFHKLHRDLDLTSKRQFLAEEYLEGKTLDRILKRMKSIHWQDFRSVLLQACAALAKIHGSGYILQDVKPENLFLIKGKNGVVVKVFDFGIARLIGEDPLFEREIAIGTPAYMSPEQARGLPMDQRSDIFALGGMIFEILCGIHPVELAIGKPKVFHIPRIEQLGIILGEKEKGEASIPALGMLPQQDPSAYDMMSKIVHSRLLSDELFPDFIRKELRGILIKAMQPSAADRFQTMEEMADALGSV
jgi:serine/threonine protein kinase